MSPLYTTDLAAICHSEGCRSRTPGYQTSLLRDRAVRQSI